MFSGRKFTKQLGRDLPRGLEERGPIKYIPREVYSKESLPVSDETALGVRNEEERKLNDDYYLD